MYAQRHVCQRMVVSHTMQAAQERSVFYFAALLRSAEVGVCFPELP